MISASDTEKRYAGLLALCGHTYDDSETGLVRKALEMTVGALEGRMRYDGTPLADHGAAVAGTVVSSMGLDVHAVAAALLHDVARLGLVPAETLEERFGSETAGILEGLNRISDVQTNASQSQAGNFRDLIVSYSTDPRIILIKLADRLEVMRSLDMFPPAKRRKKSWETINLYAQIAHKLGLYEIKSELEDLALRWLDPPGYGHIVERLRETAAEREKFIEGFVAPIRKRLREEGLHFHIKARTKSVYSIWRKMKRQGVGFDEVYDIFAIRIVADCPQDREKQVCWNVYSIVTDFYTPNPERMRDWISIPKSNGYESLHTTVVTPEGKWVEIQIRSERMDEVAERGIAAHWKYKGVDAGTLGQEQWLSRLRGLMEETDRSALASKLEQRPSSGEIFVFTPKGDLRKLPEGATVLDFAFDIHSSVGASCTGARIGQRNVSIREKLRNGDIVTVLTSRSQKPKTDWLGIVVTGKARSRIRAFLREEEAKAARLGREELERRLKNWKVGIAMDDAVALLCKHYKIRTGTALYARIADQRIDLSEIKELLTRPVTAEEVEPKRAAGPPPVKAAESAGETLVIGDSVKGLDYKFARCCNPIFGDDIFGFTTVSTGITIHRSDCPNARRLREQYPYRVIEARWRDGAKEGGFVAAIRIVAADTTGMLNRITEAVTGSLKMNIRSISVTPVRGGRIGGVINVEVPGSKAADTVIYTILKIKGVEKAYRVGK